MNGNCKNKSHEPSNQCVRRANEKDEIHEQAQHNNSSLHCIPKYTSNVYKRLLLHYILIMTFVEFSSQAHSKIHELESNCFPLSIRQCLRIENNPGNKKKIENEKRSKNQFYLVKALFSLNITKRG